MANINFNANDYEPNNFEPLPPGKYKAAITNSEFKPTNAGTGRRLTVEYTILEGEYQNRKVFDGLNLLNPNKQAEAIAFGNLSAMCRAAGKMQIQDTSEIHHIPIYITLGVRAATEQYPASNTIKKWEPIDPDKAPVAKSSGAKGKGKATAKRTAEEQQELDELNDEMPFG